MDYVFHFGDMWDAREELIDGTLLTLRLSALSMVLSLVIAVFGAFARTSGPSWLRRGRAAYVEVIRNTPFLVQIFMIFFGLPTFGLRLDANTGALIALVLNGSAYTIEIVRAGIESIGRGQAEAATALGLRRLRTFRLVVLPQALARRGAAARQPVHPADAEFLGLFGHIRRRADRGDARHPGAHLSPLRGVHRRRRHLFLPVAAFSRRFAAIERLAFGAQADAPMRTLT